MSNFDPEVEENVDSELLWFLEIVSEIICCDGKELLVYKDLITDVLALTIHIKCKKAHTKVTKVIYFSPFFCWNLFL